jgi:hypothetical protein
MLSWYAAMIDPNLSDDAIRKLIAEATDILDARRKSDLASLKRGMTDDELRHLVRQACEELEPPAGGRVLRARRSSATVFRCGFQQVASARAGRDAVVDALRSTQHIVEMFRRTLPNGDTRRCLDRVSNRLTKILAIARKLGTPE